MAMIDVPKLYTDSYIYSKYATYGEKMYKSVLNGERVDPNSPEFIPVIDELKRRRVEPFILKVLQSPKTVILVEKFKSDLPKAFKSFIFKDVRTDGSIKLFLDLTECVKFKDGEYRVTNVDWINATVFSGTITYGYFMVPTKFINNATIVNEGCGIFVNCLSYIYDRLYKISSVRQLKSRLEYFFALYYLVCICHRDIDRQYDSIVATAIKITRIESRDANYVNALMNESDFTNIDTFTAAVARLFTFRDLTTDVIVGMWMKCFGSGTVFGLELFNALCIMMTNTYCGGYIDQQMTIEKVAGQRISTFVKGLIQICNSL